MRAWMCIPVAMNMQQYHTGREIIRTTRLRISMLEHYRTRGEEAGQVDCRHYCGQLGCCVILLLYHVIIIRRGKKISVMIRGKKKDNPILPSTFRALGWYTADITAAS